MDSATPEYLFRGPRSTPESRGGRPPEHRFENRPGMVIEKDIPVPYGNEGHVMYVDVYRPAGDTVTSRPAIVWVHGGGFAGGNKAWYPYNTRNERNTARRTRFSINFQGRVGGTGSNPLPPNG